MSPSNLSSSSSPVTAILLLLSAVLGFSEACSSRNTPKLRPPHLARPRPNITYRTFPCPAGPAEMLCQNGGTCFTLFENSTDYFCKCAEGFCGLTCGDKYTRFGCFSTSLVIMASTGIGRPEETFPCPPGPSEWLCLNGGTCFTVFENTTDYACHCTEGYCGSTCSDKYTRYGCFSTYLVITASMAGAGTLVVCVVVMIGFVLYVHQRRRKSSRRLKFESGRNLKLRPISRNLAFPDEDDLEKDLDNFNGLVTLSLDLPGNEDANEGEKILRNECSAQHQFSLIFSKPQGKYFI